MSHQPRTATALLILAACLGATLSACRSAANPERPAPESLTATAASVTQQVRSPDLITDAGWDCLPSTRVANGKVIFNPGPTGSVSLLNDFVLRLQTREDVTISMTIEADTGPGLAGLQFWNSLPPTYDAANWYVTAPKILLGIDSGRVYVGVYDGKGSKPAFEYRGRDSGQKGPLTISAQRSGDSLVVRVGDTEVARTKVIGPLTGGPLFLGSAVNTAKTLTVSRLAVTDGAHPDGVEAVRTAMSTQPPVAAGSLRTLADARGSWVGAAIPTRSLRWNEPLRDLATREFSIISPSDGFTWQALHGLARDQYQFCAADQFVAFAEANQMRVHAGHLTWSNRNPEWLTEGKFSRDEMIAILRDHIQTVVGHFRGRVHVWNVTNEIFEFSDRGRLQDTPDEIWLRAIGPEYIDMAFRWAHEADPQAVLLLNDADAEEMNSKADAQYELAKALRAHGVPINGVGMQMHWGIDTRKPATPRNPGTLGTNMKRLADLGLDVYITELEIPVRKPATPEKLAAQAQEYRYVMEACLAAPNCKAFITFGAYDGGSNAQDPRFANIYDAPLVFDESFRPKPAYDAIAALLRR